MHCFKDCGKLLAESGTRYSFGYSSMTESVQEAYSKERISSCNLTTVQFAMSRWRKPYSHLFWDCPFAQSCWEFIAPNRSRGISVFNEITLLLQAFPMQIAMDVVIMSCWNIWMQRNGKIFQNEAPTKEAGNFKFKQDLLGQAQNQDKEHCHS